MSFHSSSTNSPDSGAGTLTDEEENDNKTTTPATTANRRQCENGNRVVERPRECVVCGKATTCCHFDVPSCLGCRSFFRRSVLSQKQYECHRGCQCQQVGKCRSCRFDRCILAGMNLRAIKTFSDRVDLQKLAISLERRREMLMIGMKMDSNIVVEKGDMEEMGSSSSICPQPKWLSSGNDDLMAADLLHSLKYADEKLLWIRYSESIEKEHTFYGLRTLSDILLGTDNFLANAGHHFSARRIRPLGVHPCQQVGEVPPHKGKSAPPPQWLFIDSFLCLEIVKALPLIQHLSMDAKISLLSSNILAAVVFSQSFYALAMNNDIFTFPDGLTPLRFPDNSEQVSRLKRKLFFHYLEPFKRIGMTQEEFLLLRAMLFLQSASIELPRRDKAILNEGLENCSKILMQYEGQRIGNPAGVQRYAELIFFLEFALKVANEHRNLLMNLMLLHRNQNLLQHPDFMDNVILGVNRR